MLRKSWLVVAALVIAGCGSSHSGSSFTPAHPAATTSPPAPPAAPAPPPITQPPAPPAPPTPPAPIASANLIAVIASEFAGGYGTVPGIGPPPPPPPPTITFQATFENTGAVDLDSTDPTLGVQVQFFDPSSSSQVMTAVVPLSTSLSVGAQGSEIIYVSPLSQVLGTVDVSVAIVKLDSVSGNVVGYVSAQGVTTTIMPFILYPP